MGFQHVEASSARIHRPPKKRLELCKNPNCMQKKCWNRWNCTQRLSTLSIDLSLWCFSQTLVRCIRKASCDVRCSSLLQCRVLKWVQSQLYDVSRQDWVSWISYTSKLCRNFRELLPKIVSVRGLLIMLKLKRRCSNLLTLFTVASQWLKFEWLLGFLNDGFSRWIDFNPLALNLTLSSCVDTTSRSPYPQNIFIVSDVKGTSLGSHVSSDRLKIMTLCVKFW